jgi:hypothetical protein
MTRKAILQAVIQVVNKCILSISRLSVIEPAARTDMEATQLLRAITCTKVAIKLLVPLTSAKPLLESGQTPFTTCFVVSDCLFYLSFTTCGGLRG